MLSPQCCRVNKNCGRLPRVTVVRASAEVHQLRWKSTENAMYTAESLASAGRATDGDLELPA
jgi:hypothetical protein